MFDHEKLRVYQKTLAFNEWIGVLLSNIKEKISVYDHIDEASASIALNIAEGNENLPRKIDADILILQEVPHLSVQAVSIY